MENKAVFGIFSTKEQAEMATRSLVSQGFRAEDVSLLASESRGARDFATERETKAPEGLATGGVFGGIVGAIIGWYLSTGAIDSPEVAILVNAGPLMATWAGIGVGSTVGGFIGAIFGSSIPEYVATRFSGMLGSGKLLLSVHCDTSEWVRKAKLILGETGASDIASAAEKATSETNDRFGKRKHQMAQV